VRRNTVPSSPGQRGKNQCAADSPSERTIVLSSDVGGHLVLAALPGLLGTYCALTGERLNAADGVKAGIATHRVASTPVPRLIDRIVRRGAGRWRCSVPSNSRPGVSVVARQAE